MTQLPRRWLCCLALLAALAGCQQPADVEQRPIIDPVDARSMGYTVSWLTDTKLPEDKQLVHIGIHDDMILAVEEPDNFVAAYNMRDGGLRWARRVGSQLEILNAPAVHEGRVLINSGSTLYQLDPASGELLVYGELDRVVDMGPVMFRSFAIYGGSGGRVFAHDVRTNYKKWAYDLTARITAPPVRISNSVFVADSRGVYALLFAEDGEMLWRGRTFGMVSAQPAATNAAIYVPCHDRTLYALQRDTGVDRWRFHATESLTQSPVVLGRYVFQPLDSGQLVALDAASGREQWRIKSTAQPVMLRGTRLIVREPQQLSIHDVETGRQINAVPTTRPLRDVLVTEQGVMVLVTTDGWMVRLDPRS